MKQLNRSEKQRLIYFENKLTEYNYKFYHCHCIKHKETIFLKVLRIKNVIDEFIKAMYCIIANPRVLQMNEYHYLLTLYLFRGHAAY